MFDPSSFANPTSLAHADTSRDVLPRGGTSQAFQPFQDELFYQFFSVSKFLIATPSLHVPTTNQVVFSHQGLILPQAPLTTMIWDGGLLCKPFAQRQGKKR
ncbi:hypothetical protein TNCV_1473331 [Trichonephila clavipes]|nr:hypothetical protein TNCV_1473331 [Trichonephila clavipes]